MVLREATRRPVGTRPDTRQRLPRDEAEALVAGSGLDWTILKAGVIYGRGSEDMKTEGILQLLTLIRLKRASESTGCEILGKAEFLNPGQSVKDRAALWIVRAAERDGSLR